MLVLVRLVLTKRYLLFFGLSTAAQEYTIIHPGGLIDEEGYKRELIVLVGFYSISCYTLVDE